jgi:hypothetical protein
MPETLVDIFWRVFIGGDSMKYLKMILCKDGHFVVATRGEDALGVIERKGNVFKKRMVFTECERDTEWTSECLRELADFMESQEK